MRVLLSLICLPLLFVSCAGHKKVSIPSTIGVKTQVTQAAGSVAAAKKSSEKSSVLIKKIQANSNKIEVKAARSLEILKEKTKLTAPLISLDKEKELNHLLKEIQDQAREDSLHAQEAEREAAASRAALTSAETSLNDANKNADLLQTAINSQAQALNQAIIDGEKLKVENKKLVEKNKFMSTIIGVELALVSILVCLWLGLPSMAVPWGLLATIGAPILAFGLVKFIF